MSEPRSSHIRLALFDFDGTLYRGNSYHTYLKWVLSRRDRTSVAVGAGLVLRRARLVASETLKQVALRPLVGWRREAVAHIGEELFESRIRHDLVAAGIREMQEKQLAGYRVAIVSGAFDFMLRPFCRAYGIDDVVCTSLAFHDDVCNGRLAGPEMLGAIKAHHVQQRFNGVAVDWRASCAYSDELRDLPLLTSVGMGYLVRKPPRTHRRIATLRYVDWLSTTQ